VQGRKIVTLSLLCTAYRDVCVAYSGTVAALSVNNVMPRRYHFRSGRITRLRKPKSKTVY